MKLWAVHRASRDEYIAAPSSEAAIALCTERGDRVEPWALGEAFYREDVRWFLESWEPEGEPS